MARNDGIDRTVARNRDLKKSDTIKGAQAHNERQKVISTWGQKPDSTKFYADAYEAAVKIVGGEQFILSAVMHADAAQARVQKIVPKVKNLEEQARKYAYDEEERLPQPDVLETARGGTAKAAAQTRPQES